MKERPFYALFKEFINYKNTLETDGVPSSKTIKNKLEKKLVGVTMTFEYRNKQTGRTRKFKDMKSIPRKKFDMRKWQLIYTVARVSNVYIYGKISNININ